MMGELKEGIKEEHEHASLYNKLKDPGMPAKAFYRGIAMAHIKEDPEYYTKLENAMRKKALKKAF